MAQLLKMASVEDDDAGEPSFSSGQEDPFDSLFDHEEDCDIPKSIQRLRDNGPPPFLRKIYDMVDDPDTDSIISWGLTKTSFVVWDIHRFSTQLLPRHFKHSNFSSFVRQLNTYRFSKIESDRWEFANDGFQHGKKYLLNHIKRKSSNSQTTQPHHLTTPKRCFLNTTSHGMGAELEKLKAEHTTLKMEVLKLMQRQENIRLHLDSVEGSLHATETKQKFMASFLSRLLKNPEFLRDFKEKVGKMSGRDLKKRSLTDTDMEKAKEVTDGDEIADMIVVDNETMVASCDELSCAKKRKKAEENCSDGTNGSDAGSENFYLWEKIMDDMIYEGEKEQSDVVSELERV